MPEIAPAFPPGRSPSASQATDGRERPAPAIHGHKKTPPGIAPGDQKRIFERYERVGTAPDGSGLGLAIARRLARSMGGDIGVESVPGAGSRFTLVLPSA